MNPRTEKPMPAAMRVKKLAQNRNFSFRPTDWPVVEPGGAVAVAMRGQTPGEGVGEVKTPVKCGG
jgi:hypothetical protein